jgi:hypothetical protein
LDPCGFPGTCALESTSFASLRCLDSHPSGAISLKHSLCVTIRCGKTTGLDGTLPL